MSKRKFFRGRGPRKTPGGFGRRRLAVECLESRRVLDANITSIELLINDQSLVVNQSNDIVQVAAADQLQVGNVAYEVTGDTDGFAALEGYVRQGDAQDKVQFDYSDGRYGSADRENPLAPGEFQHAGLNGDWVLKQYADRLSVALVRYSGGQATVEDRFYVKLQMGKPDLVIEEPNSLSVFTVGNEAQIAGTWTNLGTGTHQNYTEVDIFSAADRSKPIWVGTLSGIATDGGSVSGEFLNSKDTDPYEQRWTPTQTGRYIMLVQVDPENLVQESDESNNKIWLDVFVGDTVVVGTDGNDKIEGTDNQDIILGLGGDDDLRGKDQDDLIDGGADDDKLRGEDGNDILLGGDGDDKLNGNDGDDTLDGGDGNDKIGGDDGDDELLGGLGDDVLHGDEGHDTLDGGDGDDQLDGDQGNDWLIGGAGYDSLKGGKGRDVFVFRKGSQTDVVEDFKIGEDRIDLSALFSSFAAVLDVAVQSGKDVVFDLGQGDRLVIEKTELSELTLEDFILAEEVL